MNDVFLIRKLDKLGRITLPKDFRKKLNISEDDYIEITLTRDVITLKKSNRSCIFCGGSEWLIEYNNKYLCESCIHNIK